LRNQKRIQPKTNEERHEMKGVQTMKKTIMRDILKVFSVGGAAAGMGAVAIGLLYVAVALLCDVAAASGYIAVGCFLLALLVAAGVFAVVYICGCWIIRKGKFSK
jgi:hypothetical protein